MQLHNEIQSHEEFFAPSFNLQRKLGGSAMQLLTPEKLKSAEARLATLVPPLDQEVKRMFAKIGNEISKTSGVNYNDIWQLAHNLRGFAANAGRRDLGEICNLLCLYLEGAENGFIADTKMVSTINITAEFTLSENNQDAETMDALIKNCRKAVIAQRKREGRELAN